MNSANRLIIYICIYVHRHNVGLTGQSPRVLGSLVPAPGDALEAALRMLFFGTNVAH